MSDYKKLEHLCDIFREIIMPVWVSQDSVKMILPYRFSDFAPAMIEARIMPDGKVCARGYGFAKDKFVCDEWKEKKS